MTVAVIVLEIVVIAPGLRAVPHVDTHAVAAQLATQMEVVGMLGMCLGAGHTTKRGGCQLLSCATSMVT